MATAPHQRQKTLIAKQLQADPRVAQAKQLILDALRDHQQMITGVRPPNPDFADEYQQALDEFGKLRGGALYYPYLSSGIGNGPFVELSDGSIKLDLITGIGVHGFGHSHPELVEAGIDAALCDTVMQGNLQQDSHGLEISRLLVDSACETGGKLSHCFLSTSGAMANENALKIAMQHHAPADRIIAFEHCFAGRTLAMAQLTDKAAYRKGLPTVLGVDYIPFFDVNDPTGSTERAVAKFHEHLHRYPGKYCCLWMELIQGEGGYHVGDRLFFRELCKVAHDHGIAVIADEVQSFSRTSRLFAFQHFELDDCVDIVSLGKISQVCATLFTEEYKPQPGLISQTFTGNSMAILAGKAIVRGLLRGGFYGPEGHNMRFHQRFAGGLAELAKKYPQAISGPFGLGGMIAFTPFDGSETKAKEMCHRMFAAGLMGFVAGGAPTRIRFLLPLGAVNEDHIDLACQIIDQVTGDMLAG